MKIGGGKWFYIGAALALTGIVLMSIPEKACVDCDEEPDSTHIYMSSDEAPEETESPLND